MKTGKKALLLALCAVLLVAATVMGTMAYLTSTDTVVNTFTVGDVKITLDEAKVDTDGTKVENADRVKKNDYKLMPGHTYVKDPTVTVEAESEESYVRMLVTVSDMDALKAAFPQAKYPTYYAADDTFLLQQLVTGWNAGVWPCNGYAASNEPDSKAGTYEFRYFETVKNSKDDQKLAALFEKVVIPGEIDNEALAELAGVQITVVAQAIQADGFGTANAAWNKF